MTSKFEIALTGDSMPTQSLHGYDEPEFLNLLKILRSADVAFTNLETTVRNWDQGYHDLSQGTLMTTPPALLKDLKWAGIDIVSCANNHAHDYGQEGLLATLQHLDDVGLPSSGSGQDLEAARAPAYIETHAGRVALISATSMFKAWQKASLSSDAVMGRPGISTLAYEYSYTVDQEAFAALTRLDSALGFDILRERRRQGFFSDNEVSKITEESIEFVGGNFTVGDKFGLTTIPNAADLEAVCATITEARHNADWVIFSFHSHELGGTKFLSADHETEVDAPAEFVHATAHAAINSGADIVAGHGPHFPLGIEVYKGKPIFYSCGNLIFQNESVSRIPREALARFNLPEDAPPEAFQEARTNNGRKGFPSHERFWESYIATCQYHGNFLERIEIHPIELGHEMPRGERGRPRLARGTQASKILDWIDNMSRQYGTKMNHQEVVAKLSL